MSVQKLLTFHLQLSKQIVAQQGPETQRLYLGRTMLEDARQLAELKVENDDVIALTYQQAGMPRLHQIIWCMCCPFTYVRMPKLKQILACRWFMGGCQYCRVCSRNGKHSPQLTLHMQMSTNL